MFNKSEGFVYFEHMKNIGSIDTAGVVYPKNSTRILMENIEMTNCHNIFEDVTNLHGFYGTRLNESEIRNCYFRNVSGSPFKFRRSQANYVYIHDNEAYYTGHTEFEDSWAQPGFLRYSGDPGGDCPFAITFENNIFHYPFCWSEYGEVCETTETILCSVSNTNSCGEDACTDPERVNWLNNDIIYGWVEGQQTELPTVPFGLQGFSESESALTIEWFDVNVNETSFIIERKVEDQFQEVARLYPNTNQFTDTGLEASTNYEYRISVENKIGISPHSEPIEIKTQAPNQEPVPIINVSKTEGYPPLEVHLDAKESFDPDEDELFYSWFVEDIFISNRDSISYTFTEPGVYSVTLELEDGKAKTTASIEITVSEVLNVSIQKNDVMVYPNPSKGYFYISSTHEDLHGSIFNLAGKHILDVSQKKNELKKYNLTAGIYMLSIRTNSGPINKRIVVK